MTDSILAGPRSPRYAVRLGADDRPHMFRYEPGIFFNHFVHEDNSTWLEKSYTGGAVYFHRRIFYDWLVMPRENTDTFEMFGRSWIVVEHWHGESLLCVLETTYSHSLALYMLHWHQDMGLWLYNVVRPLKAQLQWTGEEPWI